MSETLRAEKIAEDIVRGHDEFCAGDLFPDEPHCSCAPEGHSLCSACAKLVGKIAAAIQCERDALLHKVTTLEQKLADSQTMRLAHHVQDAARRFHIALNVVYRRRYGHGPACDGPDCEFCRDIWPHLQAFAQAKLSRLSALQEGDEP